MLTETKYSFSSMVNKAETVETKFTKFWTREEVLYISKKVKLSWFSNFQKILHLQIFEKFRRYILSRMTWTLRFHEYKLSRTTIKFAKSQKFVPAKLATNKVVGYYKTSEYKRHVAFCLTFLRNQIICCWQRTFNEHP